MPAVNEKQRRLFAMAQAMKRGKTPKTASPKARKIAESLTGSKIREFTQKVK